MGDMPRPNALGHLPILVKNAFSRAKETGDLTYYPTQVALLTPASIPFQLRFSPSLASKPKPAKPKDPESKPFNPFANPPPALLVADLPPSHRLVLNKFAIVPEHFLLVTSEEKPQTHVLEEQDIAATYACIQAYRTDGQDLFAFFNSGEHSGASQPHRHLQLLPVDCMRDGLDQVSCGGSYWNVLAEKLSNRENKALPFTVFTAGIHADMSARERHSAYVDLYRRAVNATLPDVGAVVPAQGEAKISYNFSMTSTSMALCPRTAEGAPVRNKAGEEVGSVALNGTVLAGTALVKNQPEWDALREDPDILLEILRKIGLPPSEAMHGNL
ncbi:ATP adenylyltransferase-domain-containing protein [Xylariomycetidae sp. FL2044]|nr:ATP adenylyltransferase-domain-containing protein [Xylariomycetidae sp. FL2044]